MHSDKKIPIQKSEPTKKIFTPCSKSVNPLMRSSGPCRAGTDPTGSDRICPSCVKASLQNCSVTKCYRYLILFFFWNNFVQTKLVDNYILFPAILCHLFIP